MPSRILAATSLECRERHERIAQRRSSFDESHEACIEGRARSQFTTPSECLENCMSVDKSVQVVNVSVEQLNVRRLESSDFSDDDAHAI
jgi:hypothetical protein